MREERGAHVENAVEELLLVVVLGDVHVVLEHKFGHREMQLLERENPAEAAEGACTHRQIEFRTG